MIQHMTKSTITPSLIRVFAGRMCLLQPPSYPKKDKPEPLAYCVDVQADLSLCWSHSLTAGFVMRWLI